MNRSNYEGAPGSVLETTLARAYGKRLFELHRPEQFSELVTVLETFFFERGASAGAL